ncbi:Membrane alanyl aminopeptidase [Corynebacterium mustelae]|uniref:Aminopeptidase N n=1 Tax=Corynebacterium mustelae TaxID=571915 RepID=A0A0G3H1Y7_9CORY|nr:aminopeptidase N [Corynebacterium mustelae]AKK06750.1 Membrane alanyl aminopeptidase [Corynebacterium mustelae]
MSSVNLTHTEAQERAALIDALDYTIAIDVTTSDSVFSSTTTVSFNLREPGSTFIDLIAKTVESVVLDGVNITASAVPIKEDSAEYDPTTGIRLTDLSAGDHTLIIEATCEFSHSGQGLHRFIDPVDNEVYLYTQFETADAKRAFACFDQPDLKATYSLFITAPKNWQVITNSAQQKTINGDKAVFFSRIGYPLSTYLVAICAGNYAHVTDTWRGKLTHTPQTPADSPTDVEIPLGIYCRQSLAEHLDAETLFTETKQGFDFYHANFGVAYPFGKYDQLFVPEFNAGAMENAGAVTFRDEYVFTSKNTKYLYERRCDTLLHEMAHMWFGDLVTMRWWDDLWLNESFATWGAAISQAEATEYTNAWVTFANVEKAWAYRQDQLPSTHPISTDASDIETVEQNFDGITYAKGASVLKQLQAYVGREAFFAGVRQHFADHAFSNATFDDLLAALAAASGRDLSHWAKQWLKTTGINELSATSGVTDGKYSSFEIRQGPATPGAGELRSHRIAVGLYSLVDDQVVRTHRHELDIAAAATPVPEFIGLPEADLVLVNDDDLTYCLMRLDEKSLDFVLHNIEKIADPMARTLCWSAAWQATRSGQIRARDFIALVVRGAGSESEISVLNTILQQARTALSDFADPKWARQTGTELLVRAFVDAATAAQPGSDHQLAFIQALSAMEVTSDSVNPLSKIVAGESPLPGLIIDNQLRWDALTALAAAGEAGDVEKHIEALSAIDPSATGRACALRTRAAINTAEAKAAVFTELTEQAAELSNIAIRYKLSGLTFPGADAQLQQFNEKYFECVLPIWESLPTETASTLIESLYPTWDVSAAGISRADEFAAQSLPAAVARLIAEGKAKVERCRANQLVDAAPVAAS